MNFVWRLNVRQLRNCLPSAMRAGGAIARRLRSYDIAIEGKSSGSAHTDALTLVDLAVQELLVSQLSEIRMLARMVRIQAEEKAGDLHRFSETSELCLAIDPIDGTKQFRDKSGNGYSICVHLRSSVEVLYSVVFIPEQGPHGSWLEVSEDGIQAGADDVTMCASDGLYATPRIDADSRARSDRIYVVGFGERNAARAQDVTAAGLQGVSFETAEGCFFDRFARGEYAGGLFHSPNVYDFPIASHIARVLGGEAVWVHNRQRIDFRDLWLDERSQMLRLPGIVACSDRPDVLDRLCTLARDWNPDRYGGR